MTCIDLPSSMGAATRTQSALIMKSYRITHWPEPMPAGPALSIRKALAAMSVGWVTRGFLEREARLSRRAVDALLETLDAQGALSRCDEMTGAAARLVGVYTAARILLGRFSRRLAVAARNHHSWRTPTVESADARPTLPMPRGAMPGTEPARPFEPANATIPAALPRG